MRTRRILSAAALLLILGASSATAQPLRERVWVTVNGGLHIPSGDLSDRFEFERHVENASPDGNYDTEPGVSFDGGIGYRLWKGIGAAVAVSRFVRDGGAQIEASIPHPFFDNQPREIAGTIEGVTRTETGVHMQLTYVVETRGPLRIIFSGGPSYLEREQDLVTAVVYAESFPFDEATFTTANTARARASALGFNAGIDVAWMTGRRRKFGIGGMVRYTQASMDVAAPDAGDPTTTRRSIALDAGGVQAGGGVRIWF